MSISRKQNSLGDLIPSHDGGRRVGWGQPLLTEAGNNYHRSVEMISSYSSQYVQARPTGGKLALVSSFIFKLALPTRQKRKWIVKVSRYLAEQMYTQTEQDGEKDRTPNHIKKTCIHTSPDIKARPTFIHTSQCDLPKHF